MQLSDLSNNSNSEWIPARQLFCNVCPLVTEPFMRFKDFLFFLFCDWVFLDFWVKMIVPPRWLIRISRNIPFTALLSSPTWYFILFFQFLSYQSPPLCPKLVNQYFYGSILLTMMSLYPYFKCPELSRVSFTLSLFIFAVVFIVEDLVVYLVLDPSKVTWLVDLGIRHLVRRAVIGWFLDLNSFLISWHFNRFN